MFNKSSKFYSIAFLSSLLIACGGGGNGSDSSKDSSSSNANTAPIQPTNPPATNETLPANNENKDYTGQITEKLDLNTKYRILYDFPFGKSGSSTVQSNIQQNDKGLITEFSSFKLTGELAGKEIQGNKNFVVARIARGTITHTDSNNVITSSLIEQYSNGSYYYFAFKPLSAKLSSAQAKKVNCTNYNITKAKTTNARGSNFINPTLTDGSLELNPDGSINTNFTVRYDSNATTFAGSANWVDNFNDYSSYKLLRIQGQQGYSNQIGTFDFADNGTNSVVVGAIYYMNLNSGARYQGALSMTCNF
ncbi:hypothetical protein D3C80_504980 [compost metagenome]